MSSVAKQRREIFRHVNEELAALFGGLDQATRWRFVCECGDSRCTEPILLSLAEYRNLRASGDQVTRPGHDATIDPVAR